MKVIAKEDHNKIVNDKNQEAAEALSSILNEHQGEITKIIAIKEAYKLIYGVEPELSYVSGCNCAEDYCLFPILHGFRFDGLSIEVLEKKWKKKR